MKINFDVLKQGEDSVDNQIKNLTLAIEHLEKNDPIYISTVEMIETLKKFKLERIQKRELFEKAERDSKNNTERLSSIATSINIESNNVSSNSTSVGDLKTALKNKIAENSFENVNNFSGNTQIGIDNEVGIEGIESKSAYGDLMVKVSEGFKLEPLNSIKSSGEEPIVLEYNSIINNMFKSNDSINTNPTSVYLGKGFNLSNKDEAMFYFKKENGDIVTLNSDEYNLCLKNNVSLQFVETDTFKNLKTQMVGELGVANESEATKIVSLLASDEYVNNYAAAGDKIIEIAKDNPLSFKNSFGYELFTNSNKDLIQAELLYTDLFIKMNLGSLINGSGDKKAVVNSPRIQTDKNLMTKVIWM